MIVIAGPTASGKSALAVEIAEQFDAEIIGADSRQFFKEMFIGTARPDKALTKRVKHHFTGHLNVTEQYSAGKFELDVLSFLESYFLRKKTVVLTGGSGLYIKAVCEGLDAIPDISEENRNRANAFFKKNGLEALQQKVKEFDLKGFESTDKLNPRRLIRILEFYFETGEPLSQFRKSKSKPRKFQHFKMAVDVEREVLYHRINERVNQMIDMGLEKEVLSLKPFWNHPNLNTVGYKELISCFRGEMERGEAIEEIKKNTRRYAKRQITWLRKEQDLHWFKREEKEQAVSFIRQKYMTE